MQAATPKMSARCLLIAVLLLVAQLLREVASETVRAQNTNQTSLPLLVKFHGTYVHGEPFYLFIS